jgi:poly(A) polymerase
MPSIQAWQMAGDSLINRQVRRIAFPRRFTQQAREIWEFQERLTRRQGRRAWQLVEAEPFRAAYDFLQLRAAAAEDVADLATWWQQFIAGDQRQREGLVAGLTSGANRSAPRRRRRRANSRPRASGKEE